MDKLALPSWEGSDFQAQSTPALKLGLVGSALLNGAVYCSLGARSRTRFHFLKFYKCTLNIFQKMRESCGVIPNVRNTLSFLKCNTSYWNGLVFIWSLCMQWRWQELGGKKSLLSICFGRNWKITGLGNDHEISKKEWITVQFTIHHSSCLYSYSRC